MRSLRQRLVGALLLPLVVVGVVAGGGAYAVARSELTPLLGLVAVAALLIDYVMTVAVSTSSALDQLASLVPEAASWKVGIAVVVITLITIANLRGLRESGNIFAVPTYIFVVMAVGLIGALALSGCSKKTQTASAGSSASSGNAQVNRQ